ncbi:MAG: NapC/NirT family cytochrome c [Elusimicrobia bacterium]|nr:NapC/NirT family cytochrome c [Elusimicrobiota bacterium]
MPGEPSSRSDASAGALNGRRGKAAAAALSVVLLLVVLFGPPRLYSYSESPDFCGLCHPEIFAAWRQMGSHRRKACVDCHLPNDGWAEHYLWKGIDGSKDTALYASGLVPERVRLGSHGRKVARVNCVRCHADMVSRMDRGRQCWDCHRRVTHLGSVAPVTR